MLATSRRHRALLCGALLAFPCAVLAGGASAADEFAFIPAAGIAAVVDDAAAHSQALAERLHRATRAVEIHGASGSPAAAVGAESTFALVTNRGRTAAQILIDRMAAHQARHAPPSDAYVRTALTAAWKASALPEAETTTVDALLALAVERNSAVLLGGGIACCTCTSSAGCNDGVFCDGAETCASGTCHAGSPPCVDGDPCTTDSCNEAGGSCSFSPVPPPNAVASLALRRNPPSSTIANLTWSTVSGASAYNVYRGAQPNLAGLGCYGAGIAGSTLDDDGTAPGLYLYLVTATACGESTLGSGSLGPRPLPPGCP